MSDRGEQGAKNGWEKPRRVSVVVDGDSWFIPHAEGLVRRIAADGDTAALHTSAGEVPEGDIAFYLSCEHITPPEILARNRRNLVVHASDVPKGRGMSPLTWQILEGAAEIPICLMEMVEEVDAGPVVFHDMMTFEDHELIDELRAKQAAMCIELCLRYLGQPEPPVGEPQTGKATFYARRDPGHSRLDPEKSIAAQFDLMRVVDNKRYPAFFDYRGWRYEFHIRKALAEDEE